MTRFTPGRSGNPAGRPKGTVTWREKLARSLRDDAPDLLAKLKERAQAGDLQALRFLLERVIPPAKGQAAPVELPALAEAATLTAKADAVLDAIAAGTLAPDVGATLIGAIAAAARVAEVAELAARLEAIERALSARKEAKP